MYFQIDESFIAICKQIQQEQKSLEEWASIESDDMFQYENIIGGFDATENEFCFSIFQDENEYWLQISLLQIPQILSGEITSIEVREKK